MPKRVIDFDAMWGSDKLASCAEWAQAEYAWLYGLADASGCFELTNLRVIWGRVAAVRRNLTIERLEQVFGEFQDKGLLFVWEQDGKRYGHWTGSDVPGRLPPPSWRMRLERLAPPVPKQQFAEYVSRFARGRASLPGGGFRERADRETLQGRCETSDLKSHSADLRSQVLDLKIQCDDLNSRAESLKVQPAAALKGRLEEGQAEDWNWGRDLEKGRESWGEGIALNAEPGASHDVPACAETPQERADLTQSLFSNLKTNSESLRTDARPSGTQPGGNRATHASPGGPAVSPEAGKAGPAFQARDKSTPVARELAVGRGPSCGPVKVRPEVL